MKIVIMKNILENILIHLQPFLEKKDFSLITSHIFIQTKKDLLEFRSTDHEIGLTINTEFANIIKPGSITTNGKKLLDIIKILNDEEITLEFINEMLHIKQKHSKFKLPTFNANEYPKFITPNEKSKIKLDSIKLIKGLKKITPAIDNNNPKYELNGALLDIKSNYINLVSTDTKRLAFVKIENFSEVEFNLIIPKRSIIEIQKLFFDNIEIYYNNTYLIIKSEQYQFFTKLINGKYPDYQRIIPKETRITLNLQKNSMIESIKQITTVSTDIKITFYADRIVFQSLSEDNIDAKTEIIYDTNLTSPFTLAVNSKYLLDFFSQVENNNFNISLNDSNLPFILNGDELKTIIMPIII